VKRTTLILLAVALPLGILYAIFQTPQALYEWVMGYMFALALLFKTSLFSFWFASKLKMIAFLKGLTVTQGLALLIKRWFLDNVITVWVKEHIIAHLKEGFEEIKSFYLYLNLKAKLKNLLQITGISLVVALFAHLFGYLDHLLFFAQMKTIVSALFQTLLTFGTKLISWLVSWITSSWLAPILELFAFSYLLNKLESWLGEKNPITRFFNFLSQKLNMLLFYLGLFKRKHIDPIVACKITSGSKQFNNSLIALMKNKKIKEEYRYFERFEKIILEGHIDAYCHIQGMDKIESKQTLYQNINKKTKDNIDIVAYISRNKEGRILDEGVTDTFHHDLFLLESFASHQEHGVKVYEEKNPHHIDHTDFWVLNTSKFPIVLASRSENFEMVCILPHQLKLIQTKEPFSYESGDVYGIYESEEVAVSAVYPHTSQNKEKQ